MIRHALATNNVSSLEQRATESSDESLFLAYRDLGDRGAFDSLVHRYERELYSYLRRYLGDAVAAEDAFQACFMQVHIKAASFEEGRKFKPWLYTIATNLAIDSQRRKRRRRTVSLNQRAEANQDDLGTLVDLLVSRESSPSANLETVERRDWIRQAVAELPETLQTVVTMIYYQGMKYREVADALKLPVGTVKSRMHAAVLRLNEAWHVVPTSNVSPADGRPD